MVIINSAESNRAVVRYIKEATWATVPASGTTREARITSSSITASKETGVSEEIRGDRMIPNIIELSAASGGDINFEFSAGSQDDFFEAFLLGTWTRPMTMDRFEGAVVDITGVSTITVTGVDLSGVFLDTRFLKLEGFTDEANNGYVTVSGAVVFAAGVSTITVSEVTLVVEAGTAGAKVMDANDVIVKDIALVRFGTVAQQIDSNATNGFAAAVAAGELIIGQKIFVDGLGYEAGELTIAPALNIAAGDSISIFDGVDTVTFEYGTVAQVNDVNIVAVPVGGTAAISAESMRLAIMTQVSEGNLRVAAQIVTVDDLQITNLRGAGGGTILLVASPSGNYSVTNFAGGDPTLNGFFTVASFTDDTITVEETLGVDANAGAVQIIIKDSHLRNPGDVTLITKQSFAIETGFVDVNKFFLVNGQRVGSFSLNVAAGEIATGTFSFQGRATVASSVSVLGLAPYVVLPTTSTEIFNGTSNVGSVKKNGVVLTSAIQSIELTGEASLRNQQAVSEKFPAGIGYGRFNLTGSLTAYFETLDFFNNFLDHDTVSLEWDFNDIDLNSYIFRVPAVKITTDPIAPGGIDQDILEEMEWSAQRDPVLNTQFMIDRYSSLLTVTNKF